jgi:hypothetical protein
MCAQSQYCAFSHISEMLDRTGIDWWLAMFDIEIYWDDSGTHDSSPIAIAACYVANTTQWKEFVRNWDDAREEEGFDCFHMADFMAKPEKNKKPFCDWDKSKRNHVYSLLAAIINTRVRMGFGFGVPVPAFNTYAPEHFKREMCPDAFTFAVQCTMSLITDWYAKFGQGKAIQYIFEDRPGMSKVKQLFDVLKENRLMSAALGARTDTADGFSYQNKKYFKPLQAADMLAWNLNAHLRDVILKGKPDRDPYIRPYFAKLRDHRPLKLGFLTEEQVKLSFETIALTEQEMGVRPYILPKHIRKHLDVNCATLEQFSDFQARRESMVRPLR